MSHIDILNHHASDSLGGFRSLQFDPSWCLLQQHKNVLCMYRVLSKELYSVIQYDFLFRGLLIGTTALVWYLVNTTPSQNKKKDTITRSTSKNCL